MAAAALTPESGAGTAGSGSGGLHRGAEATGSLSAGEAAGWDAVGLACCDPSAAHAAAVSRARAAASAYGRAVPPSVHAARRPAPAGRPVAASDPRRPGFGAAGARAVVEAGGIVATGAL